MPKRKQLGTMDVVSGLLKAASEIDIPAETRILAQCQGGSLPKDQLDLERMGKYVGRVVLMSLAAELALKFAWENEPDQGRESKVAKTAKGKSRHDLNDLFNQLTSCLQASIGEKYCSQCEPKTPGWGNRRNSV